MKPLRRDNRPVLKMERDPVKVALYLGAMAFFLFLVFTAESWTSTGFLMGSAGALALLSKYGDLDKTVRCPLCHTELKEIPKQCPHCKQSLLPYREGGDDG